MNVGGPSTGKTPALAFAVRPLWRINRRLYDAFRLEKEQYNQAVEKAKATKGENKPALPVKPVLRSVLLDDATTEAIAPHLEWNPRGLGISKDEGVALVRGFNQYKQGKGNDRQFFLSALIG
jgi:hypothetical protein